jgi:hypothetical protein
MFAVLIVAMNDAFLMRRVQTVRDLRDRSTHSLGVAHYAEPPPNLELIIDKALQKDRERPLPERFGNSHRLAKAEA